ncbi:hypothetical protein BDF21DRAFT_475430 [Thamnidium elegans]|nr:hypothetical protein BDF21DRAFT_475430 [Thamnidium elegans]
MIICHSNIFDFSVFSLTISIFWCIFSGWDPKTLCFRNVAISSKRFIMLQILIVRKKKFWKRNLDIKIMVTCLSYSGMNPCETLFKNTDREFKVQDFFQRIIVVG